MSLGVALAAALSGPAHAQLDSAACGALKNPEHGPFDYRLANEEERVLVEGAHFTPELEMRFQPIRNRPVASDIDYTLRAFPNHPRALMAMMKLAERDKTDRPVGARYPVECYFDRAIRWRADDSGVRLVYGIYLTRKGRPKEAIEQLQIADKLAGEDANIQYNLGLAYFEAGDMTRALTHAHAAYALGFPLPGLRNRLERAGKWREPIAPPADRTVAAPAAGSTPPPKQ
jgi:tetratricopeptide (TPR) repeat protein